MTNKADNVWYNEKEELSKAMNNLCFITCLLKAREKAFGCGKKLRAFALGNIYLMANGKVCRINKDIKNSRVLTYFELCEELGFDLSPIDYKSSLEPSRIFDKITNFPSSICLNRDDPLVILGNFLFSN